MVEVCAGGILGFENDMDRSDVGVDSLSTDHLQEPIL